MSNQTEPSFRESVDLMFNRAVGLMDLSPGLEEKSGYVTQLIQFVSVCVCAVKSRRSLDIAASIPSIWSR